MSTLVNGVPCKLWPGKTNGKGCGYTRQDQKTWFVHRLAYTEAYGPIPPGLHIDHLCRVRNCIEVLHLEAVTPAENNRRIPLELRTHYNTKKTSCPQGHPYEPPNVRYDKRGFRRCSTCSSERTRIRDQKRREAAA